MTASPTIADEVLGYLLHHPEAQDSVEGIAQWWLAEQQAAHTMTAVRQAVGELEARGFIVKSAVSGWHQPVRFSLNRAREKEIRAFLAARSH